ncbi:MAG: hypothetical protein R3192_09070 [Woeseiaceae bacterium]|nr:hypothetical protein [Woeseiaceae bacterium]
MTARRCAYLTMRDPQGFAIDAELAFPHMENLGWAIEQLPWRTANADWDAFDAVYIGTPWDYPEDPGQFMGLLKTIDRSSAILINDWSLVAWSTPKTYLRDLEQKGVAVVPSSWHEHYERGSLGSAFERFGTDRLIIKPVISTNATDTFAVTKQDLPAIDLRLIETFANRPCVIQPFMENIQSEGEYSLFYFNREFSHAIRKTPKRGDFRVQEEHGADIVAVEPDAPLRNVADRLMQLVDPVPVYARADFVRGSAGEFLLMELELVEPSMYLRMDAAAPERFAKAFNDYYEQQSGG